MTEIERLLSDRQTYARILENVELEGHRFFDPDENGRLERDVTEIRADRYSRQVVWIDCRLNELHVSGLSELIAA